MRRSSYFQGHSITTPPGGELPREPCRLLRFLCAQRFRAGLGPVSPGLSLRCDRNCLIVENGVEDCDSSGTAAKILCLCL